MSYRFVLNRDNVEENMPPGELLLDIIRRNRHLTGTKEACRAGDCGACQILLGKLLNERVSYQAVNACLLPVAAVSGHHLVTIEGLNGEQLNPIQCALVENGAVQCGFCTPGLVIALTGFFLNSALSDESAALDSIAGNLCRCTGYAGIKRAVQQLCQQYDLATSPPERRIDDLIAWQILPAYFAAVPDSLRSYPASVPVEPPDSVVLIAGGTDIFVQQPPKLHAQALHFLSNESRQPLITQENTDCIIDALATIEQIRTSSLLHSYFPQLADNFKLICSAPVRQRATVGGNLVNASPIADLAVFFLALDAKLTLGSGAQTRLVPLRQFFQAYKKIDLKPGERLSAIRFELPTQAQRFSYEKVGKRRHLDIATVNSALLIREQNGKISNVHISAGGVAPFPLYLAETCAYLLSQTVAVETVKTAARIAQHEIAPISDTRGSAHYKRLLLRQLLYAHFVKLFPDIFVAETFHGD